MQINEIHNFINFITDREVNGFTPTAQIDMALDHGSMWLFNEMLPVYAINQKAQDALAPFKTPYQFHESTCPLGVVTLPADYVHFLSGWKVTYDNKQFKSRLKTIEIVNDDEIAQRVESQLIPVAYNPVAMWISKGKLQLYPRQPASGELWYLKRPAVPKYDTTVSGRVVTYNPDTSVQLEWGEDFINKVIVKALSFLGINMTDDRLNQFAQIKDAENI